MHPFPPEPAIVLPTPERATEAWRAWEAHLDAGRIGAPAIPSPPIPSPDATRHLAARDALFRARIGR